MNNQTLTNNVITILLLSLVVVSVFVSGCIKVYSFHWECYEWKIIDYTCKCREGIDTITIKDDWTGRICFKGNETEWIKVSENKTEMATGFYWYYPKFEIREIEVENFWKCEPNKICIEQVLVRELK